MSRMQQFHLELQQNIVFNIFNLNFISMKRIFTLLVVVTALWSCKKDDENFVQKVEHSITVTYGVDYGDAPIAEATVLLNISPTDTH